MDQYNYQRMINSQTYTAKNQSKEDDNGSQQSWDQNSQQNYELLPRQNQIISQRIDRPVQYNSKPFVLPIRNVIQNRLPSPGTSHLTNKTLQDLNIKQAQSLPQSLPKQQQQSPKQEQKQQDLSFVSKSSEKQDQEKRLKKSRRSKQNLQEIIKKQDQSQELINVEEGRIFYAKSSGEKKFEKQDFEGRKVISIEGSQEVKQEQQERILYKYHFLTQTERQCIKQEDRIKNSYSYKNINSMKEVYENTFGEDLNTTSPQRNFKKKEQVQFSFNTNHIDKKLRPEDSPDPYIQYKKSAQSSPLVINKQSNISIQKHVGFQQNQSPRHKILNHIEERIHESNAQFLSQEADSQSMKKLYEDRLLVSQKQLIKSMKQVDNLRKDLVKSTQNNIQAIFNSDLSQQYCVAQTLRGIKSKVNDLCKKVEKIQNTRIQNLQKQVYQNKLRYYQDRENERKAYNNQSRANKNQDNMIIDIGKNFAKQGKIITIYPNNQLINIKDAIFGKPYQKQSESNMSYQRQYRDKSLQLMAQMQQNFIKALKQFQQQVSFSIQKKLTQIKQIRQIKKSVHFQNQEKLQRISQQTNDREQQYDDSRGSINVLYIRKLRQFQEDIKQKQWKIERLEKQNYYLEKQLEKMENVINASHKQKFIKNAHSPNKINTDYLFNKNQKQLGKYSFQPNLFSHQNNLQAQFTVQYPVTFNFSKHKSPNKKSISSSQQKQQQKIKDITSLTSQQLNFAGIHNNKKKNTHSFHHESKNLLNIQIQSMKQKISQFQLALKQKDLRIKELQNTIMDHLESSRKWKNSQSGSSSSSITGFSSVNSQQNNAQILHMKIKNLKTLLKQAKKQVQMYKNLYEKEKIINSNPTSQQILNLEAKFGQDYISNTSKSMCISDKTTIKNQKNLKNTHGMNLGANHSNYPFAQIGQNEITIQKSRKKSEQQSSNITINPSLVNDSYIVSALVNFIMMGWSLKQIISKLCNKDVNIQKINRNANQFLQQLRKNSFIFWKQIHQQIDKTEFSNNIKQIWFN